MREDRFYCDLCGMQITELEQAKSVSFGNNAGVIVSTASLPRFNKHAHLYCIKQLAASLPAPPPAGTVGVSGIACNNG